ncbi:MAG: GntR family transcriptional regulator [Sedimenticola selenatireducens]|jgi:GntR family transcriptional repressor for pyruvate dehydrogenase complex|uniref:Pyruvate dehydrogenase complex repressor n=2 Tax=Sedimenticola selenatireducens TaxID=191960 RepID=A0A557SK55_9GAMM|nr:GntR family transcriptional regulator [Sedimenticola selenatireducens]TVT65104.1 MAG: GntR family transcriptional regulator [Sedimenticola selenatireducens]
MTLHTTWSSIMQLQPIKPARLSDSIAEQLKAQILNGVLKPGDKLPAERELVDQLKVSRPSVREALLKLEAQGLIYSRQGEGTFVLDALSATITNPLANLLKDNPQALSDVMECRHGLEELAASYAAARATEIDRAIIRERFLALQAAHEKRDLPLEAKADAAFHMAIADASHNVALIHLTQSLFDLLGDVVLSNWEKIYTMEESYQAIHAQHGEIYEAIFSGDSTVARHAAHEHLAYIEACLRGAN